MIISQKNSEKITAFTKYQTEACPENYLNHPTFGLLTKVCQFEKGLELFTTLYIQRLFFLVRSDTTGVHFTLISRNDACLKVEKYLKQLRHDGQSQEYDKIFAIYQLSFH